MQQQPIAVITGGAQGIGKACARSLQQAGWLPVILDLDQEAGLEAVEEMPGLAFLPCDVSKEASVQEAIATIASRWGRIKGLVNNAGFGINKPISELTLGEWNRVIGTNLTGAFLCAKYGAEQLRQTQGAIVNICSTRAYMSERDTEAYAASKGGLLALTHALAISLGPTVRVNSISPGWIEVTGHQKASRRQQIEWPSEEHAQHPVGRIGRPEDIADMVVYLLSDKAGFITGQDFVIDGGMTKKMIYL
jgi:NAD(P)-dependent dehydrogenase (short-subunit alcohol dehydrogenase family)